MTKNEIEQNIINNQYVDPNQTGTRNFINSMVAQPLLDSYIKNSYAKKAGISFYHGLQTGVTNNYTFMGGYSIFGDGFLSKLGQKIYKGGKSWSIGIPKTNIRFQYVSPVQSKGLEFFTEKNLSKNLVDQSGDLIESGFGFAIGKNREEFFNVLRKQGFQLTPDDITKVGFKNVPELSADLLKKKMIEHLGKQDSDSIIELAKTLDIDIDKDLIKAKKFFRMQNNKRFAKSLTNETKERIAKEIFGDSFKKADLKKITKALTKGTDKELLEKIMNTTVAKEFFKDSYSKTGIMKEVSEKIVGKVAKEFGETTLTQKIFGSTAARFITGNLMTGAIGNMYTLGLTAASIVSSIHQETAINDAIKTHLYNYKESDFIQSNAGYESLQSHSMISQSNTIDYVNIFKNHNVSSKYLKDIDPIEIDQKLSSKDNFTVF